MIEITDKKNCCGCEACVQICPLNCIAMKADKDGFRYPVTDRERCVDCGICKRVCPVRNTGEVPDKIVVYAARCRDAQIRRTSSSGGIFSLLAGRTLSAGGAVFGAAFTPDFLVQHRAAKTEAELNGLKGSKYIQSRIGDAFRQTENLLKEGIEVLFSGTPCQVAGLKAFLGEEYDNLFTAEILCHGVPSTAVWEKYLQHQETKNGSKVTDITFRNKIRGWHHYSVKFCF